MLEIASAGLSDIGRRRQSNQDHFLMDDNHRLYMVADGMGGAAAGETASQIFAQTAEEVFVDSNPESEQEVLACVQTTFQRANDLILSHAAEHPEHQGMGCTLDPSSDELSRSAKMGIDATRPAGGFASSVRLNPDAQAKARRLLEKIGVQ